jgi:hypothetical protein
MGHGSKHTLIFVGLARLPQPLVASAPSVAVELEVEPSSRQIVAATTNLQLPGLSRVLAGVLVGRKLNGLAGETLLELELRYSAAFTTAVAAAVRAALRSAAAAVADETQPLVGEAATHPDMLAPRIEVERAGPVRGASHSFDA